MIKSKGQHYNKPYLWEDAAKIPQMCYAYYNWRERQTNYSIFMSGSALPKPDIGKVHYSQDPNTYDLIFDVQAEETRIRDYDCLPNNSTAPLVNKRVLNILESLCPHDFQAFPAIIRNQGKKGVMPYSIEGEYWVVNIVNVIDAIDITNSRLTFDEDEDINDIRSINFKEGVLQEGSILLARERLYNPHIMVSPRIKEAFKAAKIKGASFVTDEEYNRDYF